MSTQEHDRLLAHLRDWCRQDRGRQSALALQLGISKQLVSAWLTGVRTMTLDEWTQIQAIINSARTQFPKDKLMPSTFPDMTKSRALSRTVEREEPLDILNSVPATLHEARELLSAVRAELISAKAEIRQLRSGAKAPAPASVTHARAAAARPASANATSNAMIFNPGKPIGEMSDLDKLRTELNATTDEDKKHALYRRIKALQAEQSGSQPRSRLRGL